MSFVQKLCRNRARSSPPSSTCVQPVNAKVAAAVRAAEYSWCGSPKSSMPESRGPSSKSRSFDRSQSRLPGDSRSSFRLRREAHVVDAQLARGAIETDTDDCFPRLGGNPQHLRNFLPVERPLPGADRFDIERVPLGIKVLDHEAGRITHGRAVADIGAPDLQSDFDRRDGPAVESHALQHHGAPPRLFVGEGDERLPFGRAVLFECQLPLVMPADRAAVPPIISLEAAIVDFGMPRIGLDLAVFFGIAGHGDEQGRDQARLDELALLLFEHVKDLFLALTQVNDTL